MLTQVTAFKMRNKQEFFTIAHYKQQQATRGTQTNRRPFAAVHNIHLIIGIMFCIAHKPPNVAPLAEIFTATRRIWQK